MNMTTNRTPATAADFVEYVAEARAEGLSDAEILVRYFKQARPEGKVDTNGDDAFLILRSAGILLYFMPTTDRDNPFEVGVEDDYGVQAFDWSEHPSVESALAWLANQLAERCPVDVMTDEEFQDWFNNCTDPTDEPVRARIHWLDTGANSKPLEGIGASRQWCFAEAARLRRMFGIGEPN